MKAETPSQQALSEQATRQRASFSIWLFAWGVTGLGSLAADLLQEKAVLQESTAGGLVAGTMAGLIVGGRKAAMRVAVVGAAIASPVLDEYQRLRTGEPLLPQGTAEWLAVAAKEAVAVAAAGAVATGFTVPTPVLHSEE